MEYKLGLNIGISSVGWGIIDSNNNIINAGVRLFSEANPELNQERRNRRTLRRVLRRRQHRIERLKNLLFENRLIYLKDYDFYINETTPYFLRKKGLSEKLSNRELAVVLFHLVKRRGIQEFSLEGTTEEEKGIKNILIKNAEKLQNNKYICEVQLENLKNKGIIRGKENIFRTSDYQKEAEKILKTQQELGNLKITDEFIKKYISILIKRRNYYGGPGKGSPYGWKDEKEWLNRLMGNCTYFPEEIRMIKNSYTAELFNLLNDLNNLTIKRTGPEKLTKTEKEELIKIFKTQKSVGLKKIAKYLDVEEEKISGYRVDTTGKALFTPLTTYITINKIYPTEDRDLIDEIAKICTYYQESFTRKIHLKELLESYKDITDDILDKLAENKFSGTHSLSKKAMNIAIPKMRETNKNSMQIFTEEKLIPYKMDFKGFDSIPKEYLNYWIINPVVKKSLGQTINVINKILKVYGTPKEIVIEMMKNKNSKEEDQKIKQFQKNNEATNNNIKKILGNYKLEKRYFPYVKLWEEQNEKCMITGEHISLEELVNNTFKYEVAHIIPLSISFDNSNDNKMLVKKSANSNRGVRTPYEYLTNVITAERTFEEFENHVKEMNISNKKRKLLLYKKNLNKSYDDFISRNLNDTRYIVKEMKNLLNRFFIDNNKKVSVRGINNNFVTYVRNIWDMPRLKATSYAHYAEDALILVTSHSILQNLKWYKNYTDDSGEKVFYYIATGEILDNESFKKIFNFSYRKKIIDFKEYKYSHYVDKKPNRKLFNETIYSLKTFKKGNKEIETIVSTLKNIYDKDNFKLSKLFESGETENLFIHTSDILTYKKFEEAYQKYKDLAKKEKVNPFYLYYKDNGYIKQGENNNGTSVKTLKIRGRGVNTYFDISHKYINPKGKIVVTKVPTYRLDVYSDKENYKFVCLRYTMIKFINDNYIVDDKIYNSELKRKNITEKDKFICSLYSGDIFDIKTPVVQGRFKFKGVSNEETNSISVDFIDKNYSIIITELTALKNTIIKNPEIKISNKLNIILGTEYNEQEAKEYLLSTSLISKQKILTLTKTNFLKKKNMDILGNTYNSNNVLKKILE